MSFNFYFIPKLKAILFSMPIAAEGLAIRQTRTLQVLPHSFHLLHPLVTNQLTLKMHQHATQIKNYSAYCA